MHRISVGKQCCAAMLAAVLFLPSSAAAFWSGPGCAIANMMTGGMFSVGAGMSTRSRGFGHGHPYAAWPGYGPPYSYAPGSAWMPPGPAPSGTASSPRRGSEILRANVWTPEADDAAAVRPTRVPPPPRNRWQP